MILILEGPNKCGKTTLAKYLVEQHHFLYFKDYTVNDSKDLMLDDPNEIITSEICAQARLLSALSDQGVDIVVDRFHLSEYAYGLVARGYLSYAIKEAENVFEGHDVRLIVLSDNLNKVNERSGKNEFDILEMYISGFALSKLKKLYIANIFAGGNRSRISAFIGKDVTSLENSNKEKEFV